MGENKPTSRGLIPLFKTLETNKTLIDLYINDICIQDTAMKALNTALIRNKTLKNLHLGNCGIDLESLYVLKNGLMLNKTLNVNWLFI